MDEILNKINLRIQELEAERSSMNEEKSVLESRADALKLQQAQLTQDINKLIWQNTNESKELSDLLIVKAYLEGVQTI